MLYSQHFTFHWKLLVFYEWWGVTFTYYVQFMHVLMLIWRVPRHLWCMQMAEEFPPQQVHSFGATLLLLLCWFSVVTHLLWIVPKEEVPADDRGHLSCEAICLLQLCRFRQKELYQRFLLSSENVFSFDFSRDSLNLTGGFPSKHCARNSSNAFSPIALAPNRSSSIFWVATFPVDKRAKTCCSALNGLIQLLSSIAVSDFTSASSLKILAFWRSVC